MLSYVLFCYPEAETEEDEVKGCINLYHDEESIIDEMLKCAIEDLYIDLDLYYSEAGICI